MQQIAYIRYKWFVLFCKLLAPNCNIQTVSLNIGAWKKKRLTEKRGTSEAEYKTKVTKDKQYSKHFRHIDLTRYDQMYKNQPKEKGKIIP